MQYNIITEKPFKIDEEGNKLDRVVIDVAFNSLKELNRTPYSVGECSRFNLWKFFRSFLDGEMKLLEEPRYMLRVGNEWFKINSIEVI